MNWIDSDSKIMDKKDLKALRKFGFTMAVPFGLIGLWLSYKGSPYDLYLWALSGTFLVAALLFPGVLAPVEKIWMRFAEILAAIMTRVILTLTFFLVITPLGLLLRILRKDLLDIKWKNRRDTYWHPVETDGPATRPEKPY